MKLLVATVEVMVVTNITEFVKTEVVDPYIVITVVEEEAQTPPSFAWVVATMVLEVVDLTQTMKDRLVQDQTAAN